MSARSELDVEVGCAVVCLKSGAVLGTGRGEFDGRLESLAAAATELLRAESADFSEVFARFGSREKSRQFQEVVVISAQRAHVVQRCRGQTDTALVAVCDDPKKLGLVLSEVRACLSRLAVAR